MAEDVKVPEGWGKVRLGEVCQITRGKNLPNEERGRFCLLDMGSVSENGKLILTNKRTNDNRCILHKNDLIMPERDIGNGLIIGKVAIIDKDNTFVCGSNLLKIAFKDTLCNTLFVYYQINSNLVNSIVKRMVSGSAQLMITRDEVKTLELFLPPLPEQHKIVEILETVDNAIEKTERIIEKYKRIKQGLMQELLTKGIDENGQIRSEETHKFKDSPLGRIPEEWEVVRLGEICYITSSKRIYFDEYKDEGVPFYRSKEIIEKVNGLEISEPLYISIEKYNYIKRKFGVPEAGDLLITSVGTLGVIYRVQPDDKFYFKDGNLIWLKNWNLDKINTLFFTYLFPLVFEKQKEFLTIGTSQNALTIEKLKRMKIFIPPLSEQKRIASILSQIDEAIEKEQKYKEKLGRIKRGLMEDLLSGKVRVNRLLEK